MYCTGQIWTPLVAEKGVMQKYLPADSGGCPAEAVLLWQKASNAEGAQRSGFVSGDGVFATAIQYAGRAHQLYILVRGGGESIRSSLLFGFHRACFALDGRKKALHPSGSHAEG